MNRINGMVDELLGMAGHKRLAEIEYVRHRLTQQPTNLILYYCAFNATFYLLGCVPDWYEDESFTSDELRSILDSVEMVMEL